MNITLMEKVYNNEVALYVNGLTVAVSEGTIIDNVKEILNSLGYNVLSTHHIFTNDDKPNNEIDYWHEGPKKASVHLVEDKWVHNCNKGCCFDAGYQLRVNGARFTSSSSIGIEVVQILEKLGHPVSLDKTDKERLYKPGEIYGYCLEYLDAPTDDELLEHEEMMSELYLQSS